MSNEKLVVVGSVAFDSIYTPTGEAPDALGGSATYFSIAASHFSAPALVAVVGEDFGDSNKALLRQHTSSLEGLEVADGKTFRWGGRYHKDMQGRDTLFTELNVFETFKPVLPESYKTARTVFLANIDPVLQEEVLNSFEETDFVACDTMNFWIEGPRREALFSLLKKLDCLIINDEEAELLTGETNPVVAGKKVQELGPKTVVVKKGPHGLLLFHGDELFTMPALPLSEVVDPTGAGDTFAGGFMGYIAHRGEVSSEVLRTAAVAGTLLASFCVEGFGTDRLAAVQSAELRDRFKEFQQVTHVTPDGSFLR